MSVAFVFPGQGSQSVGMAKEFYDNFPIAKQTFEEVDETLKNNLSQIMFEGPIEVLTDTENAQPAIMTAGIAMLRVLEQETGKKINELCDYVAGHSLGEYTALCASGAISLTDTAKLLQVRGKAFANAGLLNAGGMCALLAGTPEMVQDLIVMVKNGSNDVLEIANDNTKGQYVVSGTESLIDKVAEVATQNGFKKAVKLNVSGAFHSKLMASAVDTMREALSTIEFKTPLVKFISNSNATFTDSPYQIKENLLTQITSTVEWTKTMQLLAKDGVSKIIEVGAGKTLSPLVPRAIENVESSNINSIETLNEYIRS
ncbi:MAG: ACP S-malonyltransferase [Rickettsiales bacterium]|nr:MAG: ACP S-malonyltransferase [Rickettsiales bacterium]